jgi:hypothetical protein
MPDDVDAETPLGTVDGIGRGESSLDAARRLACSRIGSTPVDNWPHD